MEVTHAQCSSSQAILPLLSQPQKQRQLSVCVTCVWVCVLYLACLSTGHCGPRVVVVAKESHLSAFPFSGCGKPEGKRSREKVLAKMGGEGEHAIYWLGLHLQVVCRLFSGYKAATRLKALGP